MLRSNQRVISTYLQIGRGGQVPGLEELLAAGMFDVAEEVEGLSSA